MTSHSHLLGHFILVPTHSKGDSPMADLIFVSVIVAFFALALLLVRGCQRIIGSDEQVGAASSRTPVPEELAA